MKHFFDKTTPVNHAMMQELLRQAREALKAKQMNVTEMKTSLELICFNSSTLSEYAPKGMEQLVKARNIIMQDHIPAGLADEINQSTAEMKAPPFGYVLANIQVKGIAGYLDLLFNLDRKFEYEPAIVTHFSDNELLDYLGDFLKTTKADKLTRKIEISEGRGEKAWKTITDTEDLIIVDKGVRQPVVLDRPFFTDIQLHIKKQNQTSVFNYAYGKLRTVIGHFNRQVKPGGVIERSKNTLYLFWKDIDGFKIASSQSKMILGISIKGKFTPTNQIIAENIGLNLIKKEDIDFFALRIGQKRVDVTPEEITSFEVNLDSNQLILHRGITKNDFHISRFRSLKLFKDDQTVTIQRVIPFNRGDSNFAQIQAFFGTRYTEFEKVRQIRASTDDLNFLAARNVISCGHTANLALNSMSLLGILPIKTKCLGFSPEDIKNKQKVSGYYSIWFENIKKDLKSILDLSETPNYTDHNFSRKTKNIQNLVDKNEIGKITTGMLEDSIVDLEDLTRYMDDFFKLDLYNKFEDNLECDASTEVDSIQVQETEEYEHLDGDSKDFIGENYVFFKKRELVQKVLLEIEQMLFYASSVKKYAEDDQFEPDLIVYSDPKAAQENFQYTSYPAISLTKVINSDALRADAPEMELAFVKFMRGFIKKVF
ncbi:MAG: hypothetical protein GY786_14605, partial [Proteobacteria bacterium]|nr:hypothetical protein [Pseudomonadota bacterium]